MKLVSFERARRSHRGISGVLAATILFAAIFATGTGFFLFINSNVLLANQANVANANAGLQSTQENLLVTAKLAPLTSSYCRGCLWIRANNTGGGAVSIVDAYVTCLSNCGTYQSGQLISNSVSSPGSHFLKSSTDLNISLPFTLGLGASTMYQKEDIGIHTASCPSCTLAGEYVVVSLLTARGNVFSAQYPPPPIPQNRQVTLQNQSSSVLEELVGGGPQLSVLLSATATCAGGAQGCTQTFACSNGCVTVTATIYNLATTAATGVSLSLHTPYSDFVSGTASVSVFSACTPSTQTIPAGTSGTVTCQFNAATGHTGGLAAFSGHATGNLYGVSVTSAEALSNSIEIGGLASVTTQGAFSPDFFFLRYSSCFQDTDSDYSSPCTTNYPMPPGSVDDLPSGSYLAGGSNFYVAFYMRITNVFNTTLPIMQYSYTFGDPTISGEVYYFLAGSNTTMTNGAYYPNYAAGGGTPTLTGYPTDCNSLKANGKPTDSKCIYVNPGQTVTLTFAACGYGATNWAWGGQQDASSFDSSSGCTGNPPNLTVPEGEVLGIVVAFDYKGTIYSQLMPFEGQAYLRSTATSVSCAPNPVGAGSASICTATVTDTDAGSFATPTGTVSFGGQALLLGTFSSPTCTLSSGSCSVTYTPFSGTFGSDTVQASYGGDDWQIASSGSTTLTVLKGTSSTVSCSPASLMVGTATTCTVTVTDTSSTPMTPTGTVSFSTTPSGSGSFSPTWCTLSGSGSSASCTVQFTPSSGSEGSITVTGTYVADSNHIGSSGVTTVTATQRASSISISCTPTTLGVTASTTCTATVSDISSGTKITPTGGTVTFSASPSGSGTFTPSSAQCTTSAGTCTVTFSPGAGKEGTITITASYAGDTDHTSSGPSAGVPLTVTKITTSTTVTCSPNPDGINAGTTCTATVSNSGGATEAATGTVTFTPTTSGSFSSSTCTLSGGACSVTFTPNSSGLGTVTITASYGGDSDHLTSSGTFSLTVQKRTTSTTVVCSPASVVINQASTCTVTVSDTGGSGSSTPTGTVTFTASPSSGGAFSSGTCTLSSGSCSVTFTPNSAGVGTVTITGTYGGDSVHQGSSGTFSLTVSKRTTSATVVCSPSSVVVNQASTCTVTVADTSGSGGSTPTGTVTFADSPSSSGTFSSTSCTLSSGSCSVTYTPKSGHEGTLTVTGTYGGDTTHAGRSGSATVTANKRSVTVTVSCSPTSVARGARTATCTVTVTDASTGTKITPTGTVSFSITAWTGNSADKPTIGSSCTLSSGTCTVTFTSGPNVIGSAGTATITATYNGDTDHNTGTGTTTETVT
jgi:hypothetical protein